MAVLPPKDHSRVISLGAYTGCAVQYDTFDWEEAFDLIYPSPYNWISIHGSTAWDNPNSQFFIERNEAGKFLTARPNEDYYNHFEKMLNEAARHDIGVEWCFFDQYHVRKWLYSKWKTCKFHPFRNNDAGIDWGGPNDPNYRNWETFVYPLYGNWNHKDPSNHANFAWFWFKTDANDNILAYKPTNDLGEAMIYYIDRIFATVAEIKKTRPRLRFRYKGFNESNLQTQNNEWNGGRDIDERTLRLMRKFALEHGIKPGIWFKELIDVRIEEQGKLNIGRHKALANAVRPANVEIHGLEAHEVPTGLVQSAHLFSSDGVNETDYYNKMKKVAKLKLRQYDYKMVPNKPWNSKDMMVNLRNSIKPMSDIHAGN